MAQSLKNGMIGEFLGTYLLIFFGVGAVAALVVAKAQFGLWEISLTWGMGVALAVYTSAGLSGAHLNPAVTIALWRFANFEGKKVLPYIVAQILGAFIAAATIYFLYYQLFFDFEAANHITRGTVESLQTAKIFSTYPNPQITVYQAAFVEVVIAAILMGLILALTDDGNGLPKGVLAPLLIGILVAVIGAATGPLTGFALNPARDFGPKFFAYLAGWGEIALTGGKDIPYVLVPLIAPVFGALFGGFIYTKAVKKNLPHSVNN